MWELFDNAVELYPNNNFLGMRLYKQPDNTKLSQNQINPIDIERLHTKTNRFTYKYYV